MHCKDGQDSGPGIVLSPPLASIESQANIVTRSLRGKLQKKPTLELRVFKEFGTTQMVGKNVSFTGRGIHLKPVLKDRKNVSGPFGPEQRHQPITLQKDLLVIPFLVRFRVFELPDSIADAYDLALVLTLRCLGFQQLVFDRGETLLNLLHAVSVVFHLVA